MAALLPRTANPKKKTPKARPAPKKAPAAAGCGHKGGCACKPKRKKNDGRPPGSVAAPAVPGGHRPASVAAAGAGELRVSVQLAGERAAGQQVFRPCLVRVDSKSGKVVSYEAVGELAKTSFETALSQARTLAKKMQLLLDVNGLLEEPRKRNPGKPAFTPVVNVISSSVGGLVASLQKAFPKKFPAKAFVNVGGQLLGLEFGARGLSRVVGPQGPLVELRRRLAAELKSLRSAKPAVSSKTRSPPMKGEIKVKRERPAAKEAREAKQAKWRKSLARHWSKIEKSGEGLASADEIWAELDEQRRTSGE